MNLTSKPRIYGTYNLELRIWWEMCRARKNKWRNSGLAWM